MDRLGVKPLYYSHRGDTFLFASELKAILRHPDTRRELDFCSLDEYLRYSCVPSPRTIFKNIRRLPPAHILTINGGDVETKRYWDLQLETDTVRPEHEWVDATRDILHMCVIDQMQCDVPRGAFLSGGIDSGSIVSFMSGVSKEPVKTFTIGFDTQGHDCAYYDETAFARLTANHFDTNHHEMIVSPRSLNVLPRIIWHFDEPFSNITAIPTWYLCEMARQHVTVTLAGTGGDEAFCGYPRYLAARLLSAYFTLPEMLRELFLKRLALALPMRPDSYSIMNRLRKFILGAKANPSSTYRLWMSAVSDEALTSLYSPAVHDELCGQTTPTAIDKLMCNSANGSFLENVFYTDFNTYLPDNLLTYSDRMASAHSLEMRVPFCDHRLIEFTATIPIETKAKGFRMKYLLKKALADRLPQQITSRRKHGFSVPLSFWLKNDLLPLAKSMLSEKTINRRGYFQAPYVQNLLNEHVFGKTDNSAILWSLIVFELWHTLYIDQNITSSPTVDLTDIIDAHAC